MSDFGDDPQLGLRDVTWMCEQRVQDRRRWPYPVPEGRYGHKWVGQWLHTPRDRRSDCGEAVMPDDSIVVIPHTVDPLIAMAMSLAVIEAWNEHLGNEIDELRERRTA